MKTLKEKPVRQNTKKSQLNDEQLLEQLWEENPELILAELFPNIARTLLIKDTKSGNKTTTNKR